MEKKLGSDSRKPTRKRFSKSVAKTEGASVAGQASSSSAGSSLASSRVSTPSITLSTTNSSSATASCSNSSAALTVSENRLKYQYSRVRNGCSLNFLFYFIFFDKAQSYVDLPEYCNYSALRDVLYCNFC
jgi:hypothetical protein